MRGLISSSKGLLFHWPFLAGVLFLLSGCFLINHFIHGGGPIVVVYPYFYIGEIPTYVSLLLSSCLFLLEGIKRGERRNWSKLHRNGFFVFFVLSVLYYCITSTGCIAWGSGVMSCKFLEQFCMEQTRGSFQVQNTIYHLSSHVIEDTGAYLELFQLYQCEGSALWCHEGEELAELQNGDQNTSLSTVSLKVSHGFLYVYAHNTFDAVLIVCNLSKTAPSCYEANSGEGQLKIAPG